MLGSSSSSPMEASALASQRMMSPHIDDSSATSPGHRNTSSLYSGQHNSSFPYSGQRTSPSPGKRHDRPWCEKCKRHNHSLETCWKIHGKPANWKSSRDRRANNATTDSEVVESQLFSKEQLDMLQKLFGQPLSAPNPSIIGSGSVAHKGNILFALLSQQALSSSWIVDSGASEPMTGNFKLLDTYCPAKESHSVRIANGSCSKVFGSGNVHLSKDICLHDVLFVPDLDCNLLSVSRLNRYRNCSAIFLVKSCVFQDLDSGRTIDNADYCAGLYLFKASTLQPASPKTQ